MISEQVLINSQCYCNPQFQWGTNCPANRQQQAQGSALSSRRLGAAFGKDRHKLLASKLRLRNHCPLCLKAAICWQGVDFHNRTYIRTIKTRWRQ